MTRWGWLAIGLLVGCDGGGGGGDAGLAIGTHIVAAEGGAVASADGIFTLIVPPGALAEDTTFTVARLAGADVPVDALDGAYRVEPSGTVFAIPAVAVFAYAASPPFGDAAVSVRVRSGDVIEAPGVSAMIGSSDGSTHALAEVEHLSDFWLRSYGDAFIERRAERSAQVGVPYREARTSTVDELNGTDTPVRLWLGVGTSAPAILAVTGPTEWSPVEDLLPVISRDALLEYRERHAMDLPALSGRYGPALELLPGQSGRIIGGEAEWTCLTPGRAVEVSAYFEALDASGGTEGSLQMVVWLRDVECVETARPPAGEARVSSVQPAMLVGDTFVASGPETIEVDLIAYEDSIFSQLTTVSDGSYFFEGVVDLRTRADSPPEVRITTEWQEIAAAVVEGYYVATFVDPSSPLFGPMDTVTWSAGAAEVTTPAPPNRISILDEIEITPAPPGGTLEEVWLWAVPDSVHIVVVDGAVRPESGGPLSPMTYRIAVNDLEIDGSRRTGPLFGPSFSAGLEAHGFVPDGLLDIGLCTAQRNETIFPTVAPIDFEACRMIRVRVSDLVPPPPGSATTSDCAALPATFGPLDPGGTDPRVAVVCVDDADGFCFVSNDVGEDTPLGADQCAAPDRALLLYPNRTTGEPNACRIDEGWRPLWSSRGLYTPNHCMEEGGAIGEPHFFEIERVADGARRRAHFRATGPGTVEVLSVERDPSGPYPPFAAQHSCRGTPLTFPPSSSRGRAHATIQLDNSSACAPCLITGDWVATPELETSCPDIGEFELYYSATAGRVARFTTAEASETWSVESASAGTLVPPREVRDFPADVDVTAVVTDGATRWQVVFRHTSGDTFVVSSVVRL